jgi:hypothetical protein
VSLVERFVYATLGQRAFVLLCLVALVFTGVWAFRELPIEAFPDLTNNQVVVITEAPSLAAPEVEQRVSYPIETALMGVRQGALPIDQFEFRASVSGEDNTKAVKEGVFASPVNMRAALR